MKITVAACQILCTHDTEKNAEKISHWIKKASQAGIDVVSFPESALFGAVSEKSYWENTRPEDFQQAEDRLINEAKEGNIAVVCGTAHWEGDDIYNDVIVIDKGGIVRGRYSKTHLVADFDKPGKIMPIYELSGIKSCFIICHDIRYPELVRLPVGAGAQICYFCSNADGLLKEDKFSAYRAMPIARATENGIFLVMANSPADPKDITASTQSHGNSKIIHPDGNVLIEAGFFEERLVSSTIDIDEADRRMGKRGFADDSILKNWMNEGLKYVTS